MDFLTNQNFGYFLHFVLFALFGGLFFRISWAGIVGVIIAALLIEIDQAFSWMPDRPLAWFSMADTALDLMAGAIGGFLGLLFAARK